MVRDDEFRQTAQRVIRNDPSKPIKRAYDYVLREQRRNEQRSGVQRQPIREFVNIRSSLSRAKSSLVPNLPDDIHSVVIASPWSETWSSDRFLLHIDPNLGIAIFCTDENLKILRKCKEIYIDGTFRSCPKPYKQYVTVHGKYHGRVLCLVSTLLTGKTSRQYRHLLRTLKTSVRRVTHHRFRPARVMCDFEQSLILAVQAQLPGAVVSGCYFHFCQNLYRKVQQLGLGPAYERDQQLQKAVRMLMALGYLPVALCRQQFTLFRASGRVQTLIATHPQLDDFIDFIDRVYFNGPFPPAMWNVFTRDNSNRTNNYVEGSIRNMFCNVMTALLFEYLDYC
jgi:MULE transposase domain